MQHIPLELVHMDYLTIQAMEGGKDIHILVITDHFTRYAQAILSLVCKQLSVQLRIYRINS